MMTRDEMTTTTGDIPKQSNVPGQLLALEPILTVSIAIW